MINNTTTENINTYKVTCISKIRDNASIRTKVPGSKSITNRALLLASLANGKSTLRGTLFSDDSRHFLQCIQDLGFQVTVDESNCIITVEGLDGALPKPEGSIYVGSAGTAARFLTAMLGMSKGTFHLDASEQMRKRPMAPLLTSLEELGVSVTYDNETGFFPFTLTGNGIQSNHVSVDIKHSSQFLSALLISSILSPNDFHIRIEGTHGMAYIEMTRKMMEQFGVSIDNYAYQNETCTNETCRNETRTNETSKKDCSQENGYTISAGQHYQALDYQIEPDVSAACYFYALAFLLGVEGMVEHVHFDSLQGDVEFLHILEQGGATLKETPDGIVLTPPQNSSFDFGTVNMSRCSDQTMTLAALAPFASTPTTIKGIGHIRYQESNRICAIITELTRMGIRCEELEDGIRIHPGTPKPCTVETYDDHRMAMAFSLIGCISEGIIISNPQCCRKTFENYFEVLEDVCNRLQ